MQTLHGIHINATKTSAPQNDKSNQIPPVVLVKVSWASQHTICCAALIDRGAERAAAVAATRETWILLLLPVILSPVESGKEEAPLVLQCPLPSITFCFSCCSVRCPTNNRPTTPASKIEAISSLENKNGNFAKQQGPKLSSPQKKKKKTFFATNAKVRETLPFPATRGSRSCRRRLQGFNVTLICKPTTYLSPRNQC